MPELRNLYLVIAQECNLDCTYCYAQGGDFGQTVRHMDEHILRHGLERLLPLAGKHLTLSFFGGEPLLNLPLLRQAITLADRMAAASGRSMAYALTTNGTIMDEEILALLKERIAYLAVSLDGHASANQARVFRDGCAAFPTIVANLERLRQRDIPFGLRATVTPGNVDQVLDALDFLTSLAPVSIRLLPAQGMVWPAASRRRLGIAMAEINRRGLRAMLAGEVPQACEHAYRLVAYRSAGETRSRPCLAGSGVLALAADGHLYPCEHFVGVGSMAMGHVDDADFPGSRYRQMAAGFEACTTSARGHCSRCDIRQACGGQCYAEAWQASGSIEPADPAYCALTRRIHRSLEPELRQALSDPAHAACLRAAVGE